MKKTLFIIIFLLSPIAILSLIGACENGYINPLQAILYSVPLLVTLYILPKI